MKIKNKIKQFVKMTPRAWKWGIRYYWNKEFRRVVKQKEKNRAARQKRGSGFLSNRKHKKQLLFKRDGNKCNWCGEKMKGNTATIDHIIPVSKGGSNKLKNLRLLHGECNVQRGDNPILTI